MPVKNCLDSRLAHRFFNLCIDLIEHIDTLLCLFAFEQLLMIFRPLTEVLNNLVKLEDKCLKLVHILTCIRQEECLIYRLVEQEVHKSALCVNICLTGKLFVKCDELLHHRCEHLVTRKRLKYSGLLKILINVAGLIVLEPSLGYKEVTITLNGNVTVGGDNPFIALAEFIKVVCSFLAETLFELKHLRVFLVLNTIGIYRTCNSRYTGISKYLFFLLSSNVKFLCVTKCYATNHRTEGCLSECSECLCCLFNLILSSLLDCFLGKNRCCTLVIFFELLSLNNSVKKKLAVLNTLSIKR